jgi:hypothetical protein
MKYYVKYRNLINIANESHGVGSLLRTEFRVWLQDFRPLRVLRFVGPKCIQITYKNKFSSFLT